MPIYEYKCENAHVFDVIQRISDDPLSACTECGAPVKKILHPVNIAFKGSGFYSTDYSGNNNGRTAEKSTTDKSDSSDSSASGNGADKSSSTGKSDDSSTKKSA